jgi:hypothetical protein
MLGFALHCEYAFFLALFKENLQEYPLGVVVAVVGLDVLWKEKGGF